ncbi:MAG TPA: GNAT family acetyltransferase [Abditibacterium sp.]|jgi:ribosomal protein S18 acetylase RimI-like enzyme
MNLEIRPFHSDDEGETIALWHECGLIVPWNDPQHDIALKMQSQPELFLVGHYDNRLVASAMGGYDGHRGWMYYVAVAPSHQKRGFGRQIVEALLVQLQKIGCPKANLMVRGSDTQVLAFYEKLGFVPNDVVVLGKHFSTDN